MPSRKEFVANGLSTNEIAKVIGADIIEYQDVKDLIRSIQEGNPKLKNLCTACFDGKYPTRDINEEVLQEMERCRTKKLTQGKPKHIDDDNPVTRL